MKPNVHRTSQGDVLKCPIAILVVGSERPSGSGRELPNGP